MKRVNDSSNFKKFPHIDSIENCCHHRNSLSHSRPMLHAAITNGTFYIGHIVTYRLRLDGKFRRVSRQCLKIHSDGWRRKDGRRKSRWSNKATKRNRNGGKKRKNSTFFASSLTFVLVLSLYTCKSHPSQRKREEQRTTRNQPNKK